MRQGAPYGWGLVTRPIKRSLTIAGHRTSISLEPPFWEALREVAEAEGKTVADVVARLDSERASRNEAGAGGLSGAIRVFVLNYYRKP